MCGPAELTLVYGNPFDVPEDSAQLPHAESGTQIHPFENTRKEVKEWMDPLTGKEELAARPTSPGAFPRANVVGWWERGSA